MKSSSTAFKKCEFCAYQSIRSFNVFRHEERIHKPKNCRIIRCCNRRFLTKGEFYEHVEDQHPHTRKGYVSRTKYQIIKSNLKAYKLKTKQLRNQIKSIPIVERKRSIRIQQMKLKTITSSKSESEFPDVKSKALEAVTGHQVQLDIHNSSKRKFEEITDAFDDDNFRNAKTFNNLPLKKRLLRQLEGNVLPVTAVPMVPVPIKPKSKERFQENLSPEVCVKVNLDPNILCPQTQHLITEYLSDIKFELFKIF